MKKFYKVFHFWICRPNEPTKPIIQVTTQQKVKAVQMYLNKPEIRVFWSQIGDLFLVTVPNNVVHEIK